MWVSCGEQYFPHTPDEAKSGGLAKACVQEKTFILLFSCCCCTCDCCCVIHNNNNNMQSKAQLQL